MAAAGRRAATPIGVVGNPPAAWLVALPLYAELQRGEAAHARDHLAHGVPDLRVTTLPDDPWFARLRDAYLEPWGGGLADAFAPAIRVGTFAHTFAWARQRDHLPEPAHPHFDRGFQVVLRRAVARTPR